MLCPHNNLKNICPHCLRADNKKKAVMSALAGMGDCKEGFFQLIPGQDWSCTPNSDTILRQEAAKVAAAAAQTDAVKQAGIAAAGEALGTKIVRFYRESPVVAWGLTAGVGALIFMGAKSVIKSRKAA